MKVNYKSFISLLTIIIFKNKINIKKINYWGAEGGSTLVGIFGWNDNKFLKSFKFILPSLSLSHTSIYIELLLI